MFRAHRHPLARLPAPVHRLVRRRRAAWRPHRPDLALAAGLDAWSWIEILERHLRLTPAAGSRSAPPLRPVLADVEDGIAAPDPGDRWKVTWRQGPGDDRPLAERITSLITQDELAVGAVFPSESKLAERLGVSRPSLRKALAQLEASGILAGGGQGKQRTLRSLPPGEDPHPAAPSGEQP
ncbi:winged helix-turn-helix domain-containing protein [Streptomyces glaucescens]|uniref:HTH gntR-type domain-containing protein n=1 Tax=Streptomyces glaucescens TaxID=1907 RepID=A0A089XKS6_STRGA|nr:winged helix-turn-helix domain-containing protein [Streptomyces glaucescens]AIS02572.1 hypothetical protein SGLAU_33220 [Streptomyces glaucescens]